MNAPLLTEEFHLLAAAPNGVKKLRELILSLAVRGKLVTQDPKDEPAVELLKGNAAKKAKLIAEGKLKKDKPMLPIKSGEVPFGLPSSWQWVRLGEISNFGQTDKQAAITETTWVLDLEDIEKDTSCLLRKVRFAERQAKSDKNTFLKGDVLYGKLRPYLNKVIVADEAGVCTTEILPVRTFGCAYPQYLMYALKRPDFLAYVNQVSYGMKMPRLGTEDGRSSLFPLPPLAEQLRIVAKVDELMVLCDQLDAQQTTQTEAHERLVATLLGTLTQSADAAAFADNWSRIAEHFDLLFDTPESIDKLKQSVLQLAVQGKLVSKAANDESASVLLKTIGAVKDRLALSEGLRTSASEQEAPRPEWLPNHWGYERLGNLAKFIDYRGRTPPKVSGGIPLITAKNVRFGYIDREPREFITAAEYKQWMTRGFPRVGDLLFTTEAPLGNVATIDIEEPFGLAQRVICFQLHEAKIGRFLQVSLMAEQLQQAILDAATGMTATGIKASKLKEIPVPIPPLTEQHRIVAKVDELMAVCDALAARLNAARELFAKLAATVAAAAAA